MTILFSDDDGARILPLWVLGALPYSESDHCELNRSLSQERLHLTLLAAPEAGFSSLISGFRPFAKRHLRSPRHPPSATRREFATPAV
jgi:hypothetical protein